MDESSFVKEGPVKDYLNTDNHEHLPLNNTSKLNNNMMDPQNLNKLQSRIICSKLIVRENLMKAPNTQHSVDEENDSIFIQKLISAFNEEQKLRADCKESYVCIKNSHSILRRKRNAFIECETIIKRFKQNIEDKGRIKKVTTSPYRKTNINRNYANSDSNTFYIPSTSTNKANKITFTPKHHNYEVEQRNSVNCHHYQGNEEIKVDECLLSLHISEDSIEKDTNLFSKKLQHFSSFQNTSNNSKFLF